MELTRLSIQQLDTDGIELTSIASRTSVNTVQGNLSALSANVNVSNAWVNANDYSTYTTLAANDGATLASARSNDFTTFTTLEANLYNTYTALNANVGSGNTRIYVSNTLVSNTALIFEAGNGVSLTTNANAGVITFTTAMSNVTSQTIPITGTSNVFSVVKAIANSHMVLVFYNGLAQDPARYTANATAIALNNTTPLSAGSNLEVRYFDFFDLPGVGGDSGGPSGPVSGYTSGGRSPTIVNTIDKFPFSTNSNAADVGDLTRIRGYVAGQSSTVSGYTSGGTYPRINIIDKFPFAANGNATDVGDLTTNRFYVAGQNSVSHGYTSGGYSFPPQVLSNIIDKFPFAADANATDVGDLTVSRREAAGQSSTSSGYTSGGGTPGANNTIDKFPFATDSNATDVGDITVARYRTTGQQV
jgi:hypothetical protein